MMASIDDEIAPHLTARKCDLDHHAWPGDLLSTERAKKAALKKQGAEPKEKHSWRRSAADHEVDGGNG